MNKAEWEASYVEFVTARQHHLHRIAYALTGDTHRAEDLLQIALVKLYVAWPRIERAGSEEAFVRRILVRASIDESRRPWRRERSTDRLPEVPASATTGFEERTELFDALQELPPMQRGAVLLRHWLGLSVAETAVELRVGEGTVKSHTSRGLASLRHALEARALQ